MWIRAKCDLSFELAYDTPIILMLRPRSTASQWIAREGYTLKPTVSVCEYTDSFGNLCQRVIAPKEKFEVSTYADIMTMEETDEGLGTSFTPIPDLPEGVLTYLLPSRYCESDRFGTMARDIVGTAEIGYEQVKRICSWVNKNIKYVPGSSVTSLSAIEVQAQRQGVCRDLAHLSIALCRSISIPARMVVGYLFGLKPMDLHAWFDAYVGGRWYTFDPTQINPQGPRAAIACGRDAADVAIYHQFGPPAISSHITVSVVLLQEPQP